MTSTPLSNRKHIVLFGKTNVGKSSLFNAILGQQRAIVSDTPGTTTDPVEKAMELLPYGPVVMVDTAGLSDESILGAEREAATKRVLENTDLAVYVTDDPAADLTPCEIFNKRNIPYIIVLSKADQHNTDDFSSILSLLNATNAELHMNNATILPVSIYEAESIENLKANLAKMLKTQQDEPSLLGGLLEAGSVVLLVVPIDSEAPKGRLILPQVQLIRDCLDNNIRCHITTEHTLSASIEELSRVDLVVTDSQIFGMVDKLIPDEYPLTSFSILMARQKGNLMSLYKGTQALRRLKDSDRVLIAESCTHNRTHEDIGRVKLPKAIEKYSSVKPEFDFCSGKDFPEDLTTYALVVQCGGCMMTSRAFKSRQEKATSTGIPMTNYGMVLACTSGILDRSMEFFTTL